MSTHAAGLINAVPNIEKLRYLELGCAGGGTFCNVRASSKDAVDFACGPPPGAGGFFAGKTDDFFGGIADPSVRNWDVVFIDAGHMLENVVRDYENSRKHLAPGGYIFLHDLWPPDEGFTTPNWCGDGYKLLMWLVKNGATVATLDIDYGLTCVREPFLVREHDAPWLFKNPSVAVFEAAMQDEEYQRLSNDEMIAWIQKELSA